MTTEEMGFLGMWQRLQAEREAEVNLSREGTINFLELAIRDCGREINDTLSKADTLLADSMPNDNEIGSLIRQMVRVALERRELEKFLSHVENDPTIGSDGEE